jgi:lysophospholipase L1-like esterase
MKTILCYGDSNTWGWDPATQTRFSFDDRWPGVLRRVLGEGYNVIEEGLPGRTTVWDDPIEGYKNGKTYLIPCLETHKPLDLVVLLLGTNDLKMRFSVSASDIAVSAGVLVDLIQRADVFGPRETDLPRVLLLAPPPLGELTEFAEMFTGGVEKSQKFSTYFRRVALEYDCAFMDTSEIIVSSDIDGVHFEISEHHTLGKAVASRVKALFEIE